MTASTLKKVSDASDHRDAAVTDPTDDRAAPCDLPSTQLPNDGFFRRKYMADRLAGSVLLVLTSPLTLFLFVLVKLTSPGPGFYRQQRVGLDGKIFEIIKLRSMVRDAEQAGKAVWCVKNDMRVTRLGRVLRRLHLDELPQLWNVACGEMALVGPRPERPEICERLATKIENYYRRVDVKPGITGLSQINLPPDETLDDVRRKQILDLRYIQEANAWLEARILVATAMRMVGLRGETIIKAMRLSRRELVYGKKDDRHAESRETTWTVASEKQAQWDSGAAPLALHREHARPRQPR